jgi:hypothetical protein
VATIQYRNRQDKLRQERGDGVARAYGSWIELRRRIKHPRGRNSCYAGLSVAPEWDDFETFLADMGEPPMGLSIDRIDSSKGYEPGNCRWADATTQSRNRGAFVKLDEEKVEDIRRRYGVGDISQQALADEYGVTQPLIGYVVRGENWIVREGNPIND